ncbi:MAG TPA: oligoribonuclease [Planctomycetota bacterium]|nr:oligoribonuclease [Planctomycetota bacterium]
MTPRKSGSSGASGTRTSNAAPASPPAPASAVAAAAAAAGNKLTTSLSSAAGPEGGPRSDLLCWIDLEMTGLDPRQNTIIEIATLLTDNQLEPVASGPEIIVHADELHLSRMIEIVREMHTKSGLVERVRASTASLRDAELETLAFLKRWCVPRTAPLCGNSIWCDRMFLKHQMPAVDEYLHYRTIDVSSFKEVATRWSVASVARAPRKGDKHRALEDIQESIAELRHYKERWLAPKPAAKGSEAQEPAQ